MLNIIKKIIVEAQFHPTLFGLLVNPFYFARKGLRDNIAQFSNNIKGSVLDVGCGQKPYEKLFNCEQYIGLEVDSNNTKADVHYDGKVFPFKNKTFDNIISNQVFEHVFGPRQFLGEINRVLKDNGHLLLTVPFVWDEHEQPYDFGRYTSFGLKHILHAHGFEVRESRKTSNDVTLIFQLINDYIYKKVVGKNKIFNQFKILLLMAPFNIIGFILSFILPKNDDLYLDNIVLAKKVKDI